jgi:hypothetical protein
LAQPPLNGWILQLGARPSNLGRGHFFFGGALSIQTITVLDSRLMGRIEWTGECRWFPLLVLYILFYSFKTRFKGGHHEAAIKAHRCLRGIKKILD